jgi:hypothetical protein
LRYGCVRREAFMAPMIRRGSDGSGADAEELPRAGAARRG